MEKFVQRIWTLINVQENQLKTRVTMSFKNRLGIPILLQLALFNFLVRSDDQIINGMSEIKKSLDDLREAIENKCQSSNDFYVPLKTFMFHSVFCFRYNFSNKIYRRS